MEFGAGVVLDAIEHGKHVVLMNAELDGTVGPILKVYADRAGVVLTGADGDQPGVQMNLYRFVRGIGVHPALVRQRQGPAGPVSQSRPRRRASPRTGARTPDGDVLRRRHQDLVRAGDRRQRHRHARRRARHARPRSTPDHIDELTELYDVDDAATARGIVDYVVGARRVPACSSSAPTTTHAAALPESVQVGRRAALLLLHAVPPVPLRGADSVARAVLFDDAVMAPLGARVDVVATAKVDLRAGDVIDEIGGYKTYGLAENADVPRRSGCCRSASPRVAGSHGISLAIPFSPTMTSSCRSDTLWTGFAESRTSASGPARRCTEPSANPRSVGVFAGAASPPGWLRRLCPRSSPERSSTKALTVRALHPAQQRGSPNA